MAVETERFSSDGFMPPWVRHEHVERYLFAASFVRELDVIDCACGAGEGTRIFAEGGAKKVLAFDVSVEAVALAKRNCAGLPNVKVRESDAAKLPAPDRSADLFISLETFEHLPDQSAFLKEIARVLRPGGRLICSTPNRKIYNPGRTLEARPWNRYHTREYDTAEFAAILGAMFGEVRLYGQNPVSPWRAGFMERIGRATPGPTAVRINQALKLPRLLFDRQRRHAVMPDSGAEIFEYSIAVCKLPAA